MAGTSTGTGSASAWGGVVVWGWRVGGRAGGAFPTSAGRDVNALGSSEEEVIPGEEEGKGEAQVSLIEEKEKTIEWTD